MRRWKRRNETEKGVAEEKVYGQDTGDSKQKSKAKAISKGRQRVQHLGIRNSDLKAMSSWSCNPVIVNFLTYTGTSALFTAIFFIEMPHLPYPLEGCLINLQDSHQTSKSVKYLALALWNIHFVRRTTEVLFVHIYKRRMPLVECIGAPIYYWFLALIIAWSINRDSYRSLSIVSTTVGTVVFLMGEIGNAVCHLKLRSFRTEQQDPSLISPETGHIMPHGVFFDRISCPHYSFEITTWVGYFLVIWTLPAALLLLFTVVTLAFYGDKKHAAYLGEFDGEYDRPLYPKSRKRLIPFIF